MGVNNGGVMLVARKDLIDPVYDDLSKSIFTLSGFPAIKMLFYPSSYLNQIEAIKNIIRNFLTKKVYITNCVRSCSQIIVILIQVH